MIPPPLPLSPVFAFMRARVRRPENTTRATLSFGQVFSFFFLLYLSFSYEPGFRKKAIRRTELILHFHEK